MPVSDTSLNANRFTRLGVWYIIALGAIASIMITGQVLIQQHLKNQESDSHVVNVAGKQRMLSQKIVKTILLFQSEEIAQRKLLLNDLKSSLRLWEVSQLGLMNGNDSLGLPGKISDANDRLFKEVEIHFTQMDENAKAVVGMFEKDITLPYVDIQPFVKKVLEKEPFFLQQMDAIVFQFDREAQRKVELLSRLEYALLIFSLLVIAGELIFIFRPTAIGVNKTINRLLKSEDDLKKMSNEIRELYASLEKSYEQIANINQPVENPKVYAKADHGGNVTFIAPEFSLVCGMREQSGLQLSSLFSDMKNPGDWMDDVVDTVSDGKIWTGEVTFKNVMKKDCCSEISIIPVFDQHGNIDELVMMGSDITDRRKAEQEFHQKTQAEINKRINQQKFRSALILEGQEEERKRIAMDIHDGIGQMLTSLKFQVESVDLKKNELASQKLTEIEGLIKKIIREVRKVTFNLRPMVLGDYGLQAALNVFVGEMAKLIDIRLELHSEAEISRLSQKVENNIFRIIQEAINNAIKYSEATRIEVILKQVDKAVVVEVTDNGKGFDNKLVEERSINFESGRGLFNMYERSEYINGSLIVKTQPGQGTTVRLTVPVSIATLQEFEA